MHSIACGLWGTQSCLIDHSTMLWGQESSYVYPINHSQPLSLQLLHHNVYAIVFIKTGAADYVALSQWVELSAVNATQCIAISIINDVEAEENEHFLMSLRSYRPISGNYPRYRFLTTRATVSIIDDDSKPHYYKHTFFIAYIVALSSLYLCHV